MIKQHIGATPFFFDPTLLAHPGLLHAVSTRHGGVSTGSYRSLNLSYQVGDEEDKVLHNYHRLSRVLDFDLSSLVTCQQIHHNAIALIDESHLNRNGFLPDRAVPDTDGLATSVPGITLLTRYADCVPLLFYNHSRHTVAIAHAGWKGTFAQIGPLMTECMAREFKCDPRHTLAVIGPSIGPCCYRISNSIAERAVKAAPRAEQCIMTSSDTGLTLDLWKLNRIQLIASGIQEQNIFSAQICTSCTIEDFYSYRREDTVTGRFAALIGLKGEGRP